MPEKIGLESLCCAPVGKWRVIECVQHSAAQEQQLIEALSANAMTDTDLQWAHIGPFRRVVGDYDDFLSASVAVDDVRFPHERRLFNDRGVEVVAHRPGRDSAPDAGSES